MTPYARSHSDARLDLLWQLVHDRQDRLRAQPRRPRPRRGLPLLRRRRRRQERAATVPRPLPVR